MRRLLVPVLAALALGAAPASAADRFDVGLHDPADPGFGEADLPGAYDAARAAGARLVRIPIGWSSIAPNRPANPASPADPAYRWGELDARVRNVASRGMEPLVTIYHAPDWAKSSTEYGSKRLTPNADDFGTFAGAAARRYNGSTPNVPRVRNWQIWNEPNLKTYLDPADAIERYGAMLKAAYGPIHAAAADNRVVAGALAPYAAFDGDIAPLRFMRGLLCMSAGSKPKPTCDADVPFDVWSHHPYTNGGPNRSAAARDDVSLGDLPELRRLLRAAESAGQTSPSGRHALWMTEFSWDTNRPDPGGVPLARHARWVAEAFFNMWRNDVSAAFWFQLRDNPKGTFTWGQTWQSGLFFRTTQRYSAEKAKPVRQVFRFPFVALPSGRGARVWGRIPAARAGTVIVERRSGRGWRRVTKLKANANGVFHRRLGSGSGALMRARHGSETAVPFRVEKTRDVQVKPFGG